MTSLQDTKLPYDPHLFVDREEEIELVMNKVRRIAGSRTVARRIVIFYGERGVGKTWLLRDLKRRLEDLGAPHFIDLRNGPPIGKIATRIQQKEGLQFLLVDDVQSAGDGYLGDLEEHVLAPSARHPNCLIVLAERGRGHYWTLVEFRDHAQYFDLGPFKKPETEEQIQIQVPDKSADLAAIQEIGGGFPWSNYVLAKFPGPTALDLCINMFMADVKDSELRDSFEALSVLRAFDESRMPTMLNAYSDEFAAKSWNYQT